MATTPYQQRVTLYQGSDWEGVRFRKLDGNGDPMELHVAAPVSSGPPAVGGEHLTDANVSDADGDGYYTVSLDDTQTSALPIRQVLINITATNGTDTQTVIQVVADVQGTLDAGPEPMTDFEIVPGTPTTYDVNVTVNSVVESEVTPGLTGIASRVAAVESRTVAGVPVTAGDYPVDALDAAINGTLTATFFGQINPPHAVGMFPAVYVGETFADIEGLPAGPYTNIGSAAYGTVLTNPTWEDVPQEWTEFITEGDTDRMGTTVAMDEATIQTYVLPLWSVGDPIWFRNVVILPDGTAITQFTYYAGITEDDTDDISAWLFIGGVRTKFEIPGASPTNTQGTAVNHDLKLPPFMPRQQASDHRFDPGTSGLTSTNPQDAIIEVKGLIGGGGDVDGPGSAVDGHLAVFDGTTGKLIKDGGAVTNPIPSTYLDTDGTLAANSDVKVPSQKAVKTYADLRVLKSDRKVIVKSSTETLNTSTTLQDDDALTYAIGASETWTVDILCFLYGPAGGDIKVAVTVPTSATMLFGVEGLPTTASSLPSAEQQVAVLDTSGTSTSVATFAGLSIVRLTGTVINSTNAGNVTLQWAQASSSGTNTEVRAGSRLTAQKV